MLIIQRPEVEAGEQVGNTCKFTISPLEPGFGQTLGNSIRRTLLSSIPGAAITQVRFDAALHEFDVIAGVKEDVTDVILNFKDVVLTCNADEAVTARIEKNGPGQVLASDIQVGPEVTIVNPDLVLANLNDKAQFACDITIEQGRGYQSVDRAKGSTTIGVIPIDAIFSPVRRVSYSVAPTRVEQATNFDELTLEIESDGSMTPREALASATSTLQNLMGLVSELSENPQGLELGELAPQSSTSPDLELSVDELDLSERPRNCLRRARIETIGQLLVQSPEELLALTNFGQKSLDEVIEKLDERGLALPNKH